MSSVEPGIYPHVPFAEYAAWQAYSPSAVRALINESPKAMRWMLDHGREPSSAMDLGAGVHCSVFEPFEFPNRFVVYPDRRAGKVWDAFEAANDAMTILTSAQDELRQILERTIREHPSSAELLGEPGDCELSIVWRDKGTGLLCKGRPDWVTTRLTDLKTAKDALPFAFGSQAAKLGYHVAMAAYMEGLATLGRPMRSAHIVAAGKAPPYDVIRYDLSDTTIRVGRSKWLQGLQRVKWCADNNDWPGYSAEPYPLELPTWAMPEDEAVAVSIGGEPAFDEGDDDGPG